MQVCENGHMISSMAKSEPGGMKKRCPPPTLSWCQLGWRPRMRVAIYEQSTWANLGSGLRRPAARSPVHTGETQKELHHEEHEGHEEGNSMSCPTGWLAVRLKSPEYWAPACWSPRTNNALRTQYRLAKDIGVSPRRINEIVHGTRAITANTALRLATYFGTTPEFWMNLQSHYDLEIEKRRLGEALQRQVHALDLA